MFKIVIKKSIASYKPKRHIKDIQNILTTPSLLILLFDLFSLLVFEIAVNNVLLTKIGTLSTHLNQDNYFHHILLLHILCISFLLDYLPQL